MTKRKPYNPLSRPNSRIFTADEDALIRSGNLSAYQIAERIGTEYRTVARRATVLGVELPKTAKTIRKARELPDTAYLRRFKTQEAPAPVEPLTEDATKVIVWKPRHGRTALSDDGDDLVPISIPRIKCIHGEYRG